MTQADRPKAHARWSRECHIGSHSEVPKLPYSGSVDCCESSYATLGDNLPAWVKSGENHNTSIASTVLCRFTLSPQVLARSTEICLDLAVQLSDLI